MKMILCLILLALTPGQTKPKAVDSALYEHHDWFTLKDRIAAGENVNSLARGATFAAFGDDEKARHYLQPLTTGNQASEAQGWLSYIEMREGHYGAAAEHIEASDPNGHNPLAATFRNLPDQVLERNSPASVRYRILQRKLFVPMSLNKQAMEFFLDSDANLSFLSETAAKRLGLTIQQSAATTSGALGAASQLRMTSADVKIGSTQLRNVAFMVLPDNASLFTTLSWQQQGALGLPVLRALEQMSWDRDGNFRIGAGYDAHRPASSLAFDGADPIVRFTFKNVAMTGVLDTGAETTTLWPPFAKHFSRLVTSKGIRSTREVRGFGGDGKVPEMVLPELDFTYGGATVRATPAHVLIGTTTANSEWLAGRMGLDLLLQGKTVTVDFRARKLQVTR